LKSKQLVFRDEAGADPVALYTYIAQASGSFHTAFCFTERLRTACFKLVTVARRAMTSKPVSEF
jgi:hypothetical protein